MKNKICGVTCQFLSHCSSWWQNLLVHSVSPSGCFQSQHKPERRENKVFNSLCKSNYLITGMGTMLVQKWQLCLKSGALSISFILNARQLLLNSIRLQDHLIQGEDLLCFNTKCSSPLYSWKCADELQHLQKKAERIHSGFSLLVIPVCSSVPDPHC